MYGSRITIEEKSTIRTYAGGTLAVLLMAGACYLFLLAHEEKMETTGFDANRPVPSDAVLQRRLTAEQYWVVRHGGSQTPFQNEYWNNTRPGIYVDVITGEPLFTSLDKFDNGMGAPAFRKPISKDLLVESLDTSYGMQRIEVRAKRSNAHLGHLLPDPTAPGGQSYSINSAALRFIPRDEMKDKSYEAYLPLLRPK